VASQVEVRSIDGQRADRTPAVGVSAGGNLERAAEAHAAI
jgi:hypothetical protein